MGILYRKKPVVIEAVQYLNDTFSYSPYWINDAFKSKQLFKHDGELFIETLEGNMRVSDGDYIIRGIQGELYSCKPYIFSQTYEKVV